MKLTTTDIISIYSTVDFCHPSSPTEMHADCGDFFCVAHPCIPMTRTVPRSSRSLVNSWWMFEWMIKWINRLGWEGEKRDRTDKQKHVQSWEVVLTLSCRLLPKAFLISSHVTLLPQPTACHAFLGNLLPPVVWKGLDCDLLENRDYISFASAPLVSGS